MRCQSSLQVTASGPPSSIGVADPVLLHRQTNGADEIVDPDRLHTLRPGADHRRDRRQAGEPQETRQRAPVRPEDEARPQDGVVDTRRRDRLLRRPLRPEVRDGRAGPRPERAHQHDAADAALARRLDEVPSAGCHHALERRRRACDDRDEVDDRADAARRCEQRGRIVDVATDQLAVDAFERGGPARRPHERAHTHAADGQVADDVAPDEAARAGDEDHPPSVKFCQ